MSGEPLVFTRDLAAPVAPIPWPEGLARLPFSPDHARIAHAILAEAYGNGFGDVGLFANWYETLTTDEEYEEALCFLFASDGEPAGFAQVWTSGFIKDIAVAEGLRRQGIGRTLLLTVFAELKARGHSKVRLKVHPGNAGAIAMYRAVGMRSG